MNNTTKQFVRISDELREQADTTPDIWADSPFEFLRLYSSKARGRYGELLVKAWLERRKYDVIETKDTEADLIVNGFRVEIKMSTLWSNGCYKFQQIRDQDYRHAVLLGLSPKDVHLWVVPKAILMKKWERQIDVRSQHGGAKGVDTAWLQVDPSAPPAWLARYGGGLRLALIQCQKTFYPKKKRSTHR